MPRSLKRTDIVNVQGLDVGLEMQVPLAAAQNSAPQIPPVTSPVPQAIALAEHGAAFRVSVIVRRSFVRLEFAPRRSSPAHDRFGKPEPSETSPERSVTDRKSTRLNS